MRRTFPTHIPGTYQIMSLVPIEMYINTYNEPFVSNGDGEIAIEGDSIVVRIVPLITNNVFKKSRLMSQNFGKPTAEMIVYEQGHIAGLEIHTN
jgi:hypothetical protein